MLNIKGNYFCQMWLRIKCFHRVLHIVLQSVLKDIKVFILWNSNPCLIYFLKIYIISFPKYVSLSFVLSPLIFNQVFSFFLEPNSNFSVSKWFISKWWKTTKSTRKAELQTVYNCNFKVRRNNFKMLGKNRFFKLDFLLCLLIYFLSFLIYQFFVFSFSFLSLLSHTISSPYLSSYFRC